MNPHVKPAPGSGDLQAPRRNRYYFGKLMDVLHFEQEQTYSNNQRRLLNRLTLGEGVLCGLLMDKTPEGKICVSRGVALDATGREIIVPATVCFDPWQLTDECGQPAGTLSKSEAHLVHLCLAYRECETDFAPVVAVDCDSPQNLAAGTIVESFRITVREGPPGPRVRPDVDDALFGGFAGNLGYELLHTIDTGGTPVAIDVTHDGKIAIAANDTTSTLQAIDVETWDVTPLTDPALQAPFGSVSVAPEGGPFVITHANGLTMVDVENGAANVLGSLLSGTAYGPCAAAFEGDVLFAINSTTNNVDRIDVPAEIVAASIEVDTAPIALAVSPDSKWLYIAHADGVVRVDTSSNQPVASDQTNTAPQTIAARMGGQGAQGYAGFTGGVRRIPLTGSAVDFAVPADVRASDFTSDGQCYYAAGIDSQTGAPEMVVFSAATMMELGRVPVGNQPTSIAVAPGSRRAFIANRDSGTISVIDALAVPQHRWLCEELSGVCSKLPTGCPCVVLGTVELQPGGTIGALDACSERPVIFSNAMLLEFILCLAARLEDISAG